MKKTANNQQLEQLLQQSAKTIYGEMLTRILNLENVGIKKDLIETTIQKEFDSYSNELQNQLTHIAKVKPNKKSYFGISLLIHIKMNL